MVLRWFGLRWRLLIGWLLVWRIIWRLIVPMLLFITRVGRILRLALREALIIVIASSLSTHICDTGRRGKTNERRKKKQKGQQGFFRFGWI